jgi:hypothetical protein
VKYTRYIPDFFITESALLTVSEKMRDLLVHFGMGENQLIEVPFLTLMA